MMSVKQVLLNKSESTRRKILSLVFCFLTSLCWSLSNYTINWKAYIDSERGIKQNQPLAVTLMLMAIGISMSAVVTLAICPQVPFKLDNPKQACWSIVTGLLYALGISFYVRAANAGAPASVTAPVAGLYIVTPVLWDMLANLKCVSRRILLGFTCSIVCLFLYSGVFTISHIGESQSISAREWSLLAGCIVPWGIGLITQDKAAKGLSLDHFPQTQLWYALGNCISFVIIALWSSVTDLTERSNWLPFVFDHWLMIMSAFFGGGGSGLFTLCLAFAEDSHLMLGITSMYPSFTAILGLVFLHEPATWNVLLALCFATLGALILSSEVENKLVSVSNTSYNSITSLKEITIDEEEIPLLIKNHKGYCAA